MTRPSSGEAAERLSSGSTKPPGATEEIEVRGHIVDSLLLPKILDRILLMGGTFEIRECRIGVKRSDPSYARIAISADSHDVLNAILGDLVEHGASPVHLEDARTVRGRYRRRRFRTASTARPTSPRRSGWAADGSTSTTRRWTAGSWSTGPAARRGACR